MDGTPLLGGWLGLSGGRRKLLGCGVGLIGVVITLALALAVNSLTRLNTPAVAFLFPVLGAALFGLVPGLVTTLAAALVVDYFLLLPVGPYPPSTPDDLLMLASLTGLSIVVSMLVSALTQARWSYQSLVQAAPSAILRTDPGGRITAANPAAEALLGQPVTALVGQPLDVALGGDGPSEDRPWRRLERPPGSVALQEVRAPLPGEEGQVCILQDVTAEVAQLEHKEAFLLRVAHELRTPVTAQSALLEILAHADRLDGGERRLATRALEASRRLEALIEGVLDLRSVRAGSFEIERMPVPLQQVVGEAAATVEPLLQARGQSLLSRLPRRSLIVHADRRRLVQVLVNLLSNASRYGPDGQQIRLAATPADDVVRVEVRNGQGSGDTALQTPPGLGLGLSIARAIVEAHDGRLDLELGPGDAVARVTLPLAASP
jgi:signal transduction histidine kinase